jgi:hypothetical protein
MAFNSAKKINSPAPAVKGKKTDRETIEFANMEQYSHLQMVSKACEGAIKAFEAVFKEHVFELFMKRIRLDGKKPDSIDAIEGLATVNLQCRKRGTNSPLSADEVEILTQHKLQPDYVIKTPKLFVINPEYAEDEELMNRVEALLKKNGLLKIIGVQEEVKIPVVGDKLLDAALATKKPEVIKQVITMAFKPSLSEVKPEEIAKTMSEILDINIAVEQDEKTLITKVTEKVVGRLKKKPPVAALLKA